MKIIDSELYNEIVEKHKLNIGDFYFFKDIIIAEINEGVHLDINNCKAIIKITNQFYKGKPFGHISNRVNQYSVSPLDYENYSNELNSVTCFSTVISNSHFNEMSAEIEKHFIKKPYNISNNIEDALKWTSEIIKESKAKVYV